MDKDDIEEELLYGDSKDDEAPRHHLFDPKEVDIVSQTMVISNIVDRLAHDDIILDPDFQRNPDLWSEQKQSRLIESLIIRIPLPTFYFNYDDDDKYTVVDGLQRLYSMKRFMVFQPDDPRKLKLKGLEYLEEFEGMTFEELPANIRRRINEQTVAAYVIRPGTSDLVQNSIFTRINTGGLRLTAAEVRNSIYRGQAAELLKELAHSDDFITATRGKVSPVRMLDREFVNRFLAFYLLDIKEYEENLDQFLNEALGRLKTGSEKDLENCRTAFHQAMALSIELFDDKAFRRLDKKGKYSKLNKPLFECVSVCFARLNRKTVNELKIRKKKFLGNYEDLLVDPAFAETIASATARINNILKRNEAFAELLRKTVEYDQIFSN